MRADLGRNYDSAIADATQRGALVLVRQLEFLLGGTVAIINIDPKLLYNLAAGQHYLSYYKAVEAGLRKIAERKYHAHRGAVDEKIHSGYKEEILNAALSTGKCGLTNYGAITLELHEASVKDRASVMRENAYDFFDRYKLGDRNAEEVPGWRSVWADRVRLGVAHLAPALTSATANHKLADHILLSGHTRPEDRYFEVHIYGSLSWRSINKNTLEVPLTDPEDQQDWNFGRQKLAARGITVIDRVSQ